MASRCPFSQHHAASVHNVLFQTLPLLLFSIFMLFLIRYTTARQSSSCDNHIPLPRIDAFVCCLIVCVIGATIFTSSCDYQNFSMIEIRGSYAQVQVLPVRAFGRSSLRQRPPGASFDK